jgi:hypothetical protein
MDITNNKIESIVIMLFALRGKVLKSSILEYLVDDGYDRKEAWSAIQKYTGNV